MKKRIDNELIMDAAVDCFSKYGYKKTTLEDIASELGILASSIYAYTQSKRDLYEEAVRYVLLRWQNRVKEAVCKIASPREKLIALMRTALLYLSTDTAFCALLKNDPSIFPMFPTADPYEEINGESVMMLQRVLEEGVTTGVFRKMDTYAVADIIFSMYKSFIIHAYVKGEKEYLEQYMENTIDLIVNGVNEK